MIAFLMAMSNAWGLLLCIVFLGYGLVDIPRLFWRQSDLTWIQSYYQFKAPKLKDDSLNASEELQKVVRVNINIYIYIYRERERKNELTLIFVLNLFIY